MDLRSFGPTEVIQHTVMEHEDLQTANTKLHPGNVLPHDRGTAVAEDGRITALLSKASWNVIRLRMKN